MGSMHSDDPAFPSFLDSGKTFFFPVLHKKKAEIPYFCGDSGLYPSCLDSEMVVAPVTSQPAGQ